MAVTREMLLSELRDLLRLTAFEQTVATVRRAQARTPAIQRELAENAAKASERLALLRSALASLGGGPDVVTPAVGRLGAFLQAQMNQVQTLQGALLGDLALEHQLRERTRYARSLAQTLGEQQLLPVLDRLELAHSKTIEWLEARLEEVARTGTSALRATPVQTVVTSVRRSATLPLSVLVAGVNQIGGLVGRVTGRAPQPLQDALAQVEGAARSAGDRVIDLTGRASSAAETTASQAADAASRAGETARTAAGAAQETAQQTAEQVTERVLDATGGSDVDEDKPPFPGYDQLTGDSVIRHVADSDDVEHLRVLLAYEQAHKGRKGVLKAAQDRLEELAPTPR